MATAGYAKTSTTGINRGIATAVKPTRFLVWMLARRRRLFKVHSSRLARASQLCCLHDSYVYTRCHMPHRVNMQHAHSVQGTSVPGILQTVYICVVRNATFFYCCCMHDNVPVEFSKGAFSSPTAIARLGSWSSSVTRAGHADAYFRDRMVFQCRRGW